VNGEVRFKKRLTQPTLLEMKDVPENTQIAMSLLETLCNQRATVSAGKPN
jgi:hypothetical protein